MASCITHVSDVAGCCSHSKIALIATVADDDIDAAAFDVIPAAIAASDVTTTTEAADPVMLVETEPEDRQSAPANTERMRANTAVAALTAVGLTADVLMRDAATLGAEFTFAVAETVVTLATLTDVADDDTDVALTLFTPPAETDAETDAEDATVAAAETSTTVLVGALADDAAVAAAETSTTVLVDTLADDAACTAADAACTRVASTDTVEAPENCADAEVVLVATTEAVAVAEMLTETPTTAAA